MKVCIFGAGAVGGHLAARLGAAGHEVSAVARGANLAGIRAKGITLHSGGKTLAARVRASDDPAELGPQDAVFITLKQTALASVAASAAALTDAGTVFVFVQNGIPWWYAQGLCAARPRPPDLSALDPGGRLARAFAPQRVVGGAVYSSNDVLEPGVIKNHTPGRNMLVIGAPDDSSTERIAALRAMLAAAEIRSPPVPDMRASVWDKLLINFGASLCVAIGEPVRALMQDPPLRELRGRLIEEGRAVARAHGVDVGAAPRRPGGWEQGSGATDHKPSMLQDLEIGRPMEVEAILKMPVAFARAAGVATPTLDTVVAIVARLAAAKGLYTSLHAAAEGQADRPRG